MTSRSSFFKLMWEDLRQRLWTIVLAFVVFVLPVPIAIAMMLTNRNSSILDVPRILQAQNVWFVLVTVTGALICAVSGFGYLFSKKKVDFFHSLPVKREIYFLIRYINGVFIYLVPYLAMLMVSFLIIAVSGNFDTEILRTAMQGLLVHFLGYLIVYTTFILCVIAAGNLVVFFAVSGWCFGITAITVLLYDSFEQTFFHTYSYFSDSYSERMHSLRFLSPGYFYNSTVMEPEASMLLQELLCTAILFAVALLLYRIRPSEGAGKAIAFPVLKPVFRVSAVVLAGSCIGLLFYHMADIQREGLPGWMIFGTLLGALLSHMFIESVYHYDIRKCLANKLSLLACAAVSVIFVLLMRYDVAGYDRYLPDKKKLASVAIDLTGLDGYGSIPKYVEQEGYKGIVEVDKIDDMNLTEMETVYPYLEALVKDTEEYWDSDRTRYGKWFRVRVAYRLKNGKTVYREYHSDGLREELLAPVFESPEYKRCQYAGVYTIPAEALRTVSVQYAMNQVTMTLSTEEKEGLLEILQREVDGLTLGEKTGSVPVAVLTMSVAVPEYDDSRMRKEKGVRITTVDVPLYASYTETLRFLEARGFSLEKNYEWTGEERMELYWNHSGEYTEAYFDDSSFQMTGGGEYKTTYGWDYDGESLNIKPEDWQAVYELCDWEVLWEYAYSGMEKEYHRVVLDIPVPGYNSYERYLFRLDKDADLSFLFD